MPNFHVILVHFPIALLSLYVVVEVFKFKILESIPGWQTVKNFLLIVGALSAIPASLSGIAIHEGFEKGGLERQLKVHQLAALFTTAYFFGLAVARIFVLWAKTKENYFATGLSSLVLSFFKFFSDSPFTLLFASLGLVSLLVTSILGGIIAFGPDVDPFTKILNYLLF